MTIREQIEQKEKELAALKEQEQAEREEARKQEQEEKTKRLEVIKTLLSEYNAKYNDTLCLGIARNSKSGDSLLSELFPWL